MTWAEAEVYIDGLTLGGRNRWRFPTDQELAALAGGGSLETGIFTAVVDRVTGYWATPENADEGDDKRAVSVDSGEVSEPIYHARLYVLAVRNGR